MPKVNEKAHIIIAQPMTAGVLSTVLDGRYLQNIKFQMLYTGSPVGTLTIEESLDYVPTSQTGDWSPSGATIAAVSAAGSQIINLPNQGPAFYRVRYAFTSGTGTLDVYGSGSGPL